MKSKILYTTASTSPQSGAFRILLDMVRGVKQHDFSPVLALPGHQGSYNLLSETEIQVTHFLRLPRTARDRNFKGYAQYLLQNVRASYELAKIIKEEDISIVHANEIFDIYAAIAARITGTPCVWSVRADLSPWPVIQMCLTRLASALAETIIVASRSVHKNMFRGVGINQNKIRILYEPGFDFTDFNPHVDGNDVRREFTFGDDEFVIALVAKLVRRKGHETFVRAIPQVLKAFPDSRFLVAGGELNGNRHRAYADGLRKLVEEKQINEHVIFTGYRDDVPKVMAAADVITHCSSYPDPFPGVVLQGMALGKPVIASNLGGPREQIEHGVTGLLVEPSNPSLLAGAICELLADAEMRRSLGKQAACAVREKFPPGQYYDELRKLYCDVIRHR